MIGSSYRETEIVTASPERLVALLYEGALRSCAAAAAHHQGGRVRERGEEISRALAIVGELRESLDCERGGEIARNLDALYLFVAACLFDAHSARRPEALAEAQSVLQELHGAWDQIARGGAGAETAP